MGYQLIKSPANKLPLANESIQCVVTSPPYWGLRKYDGLQDLIWGGRPECEHDFADEKTLKSRPQRDHNGPDFGDTRGTEPAREKTVLNASCGGTCIRCGAWRGGFGLEPSLKLYIDHTVEILREIRRVLKPDGVVFWNVDDSYVGSNSQHKNGGSQGANSCIAKKTMSGIPDTGRADRNENSAALGIKPKDLCLLPQRIAIAAQEDGWWVRQDIIWAKPNPMPESVRDRFTAAYEHIFMFTKSAKYFWDAEACQEPAVNAGKIVKLGEKSFAKRQADGMGVAPSGNGNATEYKVRETRNIRNVWTFPTQPFKGAHFATFPEELPRRCIKAATRIGDTVLDPFCGSGTTGKVSLELGRNFVGTDLEYQELAKQRIEKAFPELAAQEVLTCPQTEQLEPVFAASEFD